MANLSHANMQYSLARATTKLQKVDKHTCLHGTGEYIYVGPYLGFANTDKTTEQVEYTALEK